MCMGDLKVKINVHSIAIGGMITFGLVYMYLDALANAKLAAGHIPDYIENVDDGNVD